jgi:hypothetical protein
VREFHFRHHLNQPDLAGLLVSFTIVIPAF